MKLKDFISTVDYHYNVYAGNHTIGYHCVQDDNYNLDWMLDYEVKSIDILSNVTYQVNLISPKKPWVAPDYIIGRIKLIENGPMPKGCYTCINNPGKRDECFGCNTITECYINWKNLFIKED